MVELPAPLNRWFASRGWTVRGAQRDMLGAAAAGAHALLVAPTGSGKTLAGFLPTLADLIENPAPGLHTLYVSPLKALAADVARNLITPITDMGLDIRVETRTGDTSSEHKKRQRHDPPQILLTTPESLSLLLSYADAAAMLASVRTVIIDEVHAFATSKRGDLLALALARLQTLAPAMRRVGLSATIADPEAYMGWLAPDADAAAMLASVRTVIIDEVHAFATTKRGDLLALALARLQTLAPAMRRVGLSATIADPEAYMGWLAPDADAGTVRLVRGAAGAPAEIDILLPEDRIPWAGHTGRYAARQVYQLIAAHRLTIVFVNTRAQAEMTFRDLWTENDAALPIGIHHGSLAPEARQRVEAAMAEGRLRAIVATASLDLGIDWGDVDLVVQMGAPKGASRLLQRIGRANHRLDTPSKAVIVPGNRFEYLEALAARDAVAANELDHDDFRPGGLDVLAQHLMGLACAAPLDAEAAYAEVRRAAPYAGLPRAAFDRVLGFIGDGGYSLRAYDRFRRLVPEAGRWRLAHPRLAATHRLNAGTIVESPQLAIRFGRPNSRGMGRSLGRVEEWFGAQLRVGDSFLFAGQTLEVTGFDESDILVTIGRGPPRVPSYNGGKLPLTSNLARRVRALLNTPARWAEMPGDVHEWLDVQRRRSQLPGLDDLLIETFPEAGRMFMVAYGFEGRNAHQTLGMLLTQRMEAAGLQPLGFVANDYMVAVWSLQRVTDPAPLFSPEVLEDELARWMANSPFLRRAFREVAVIAGLIERGQPGRPRTGKSVTFSADLIYDVLQRHEPDHLLLTAAWADARAKLTDIARLVALLDRAQTQLVQRDLDRVSPLAIPVLLELGREPVHGSADEALLMEADALAAVAMRPG